MKYCVLIFFYLACYSFTIQAKKAAQLGMGVAVFNFDSTTVINFYKDTTDKNPEKQIEFFEDTSINSYNIRNLESYQATWLKPEALWIDYSFLNFRIEYISKNWIHLFVNNETGYCLWVKKSKLCEIKSWERYLRENVTVVDNLDPENNKVRVKPDLKADTIHTNPARGYSILKVSGEWIQVSYGLTEDGDLEGKGKPLGWIKWRDGDVLLIDYSLTC